MGIDDDPNPSKKLLTKFMREVEIQIHQNNCGVHDEYAHCCNSSNRGGSILLLAVLPASIFSNLVYPSTDSTFATLDRVLSGFSA